MAIIALQSRISSKGCLDHFLRHLSSAVLLCLPDSLCASHTDY